MVSLRLDEELLTPAGNRYILKSEHRSSPTRHKSVWSIPASDEIACFDAALIANWVMNAVGWGLHFVANVPVVLGRTLLSDVKIGKFVSDPPNALWHGYPADYRGKQQDRPPIEILMQWRDAGHIEKHEMSKVRQGKPCSLSD